MFICDATYTNTYEKARVDVTAQTCLDLHAAYDQTGDAAAWSAGDPDGVCYASLDPFTSAREIDFSTALSALQYPTICGGTAITCLCNAMPPSAPPLPPLAPSPSTPPPPAPMAPLGSPLSFQKLSGNMLDWYAARAACDAAGGHLPVIRSADEQQQLMTFFGANGVFRAWTALSDTGIEGGAGQGWNPPFHTSVFTPFPTHNPAFEFRNISMVSR